MTVLSAHRRVLGVIGVCYGPGAADLASAYATFERQCRCGMSTHGEAAPDEGRGWQSEVGRRSARG